MLRIIENYSKWFNAHNGPGSLVSKFTYRHIIQPLVVRSLWNKHPKNLQTYTVLLVYQKVYFTSQYLSQITVKVIRAGFLKENFIVQSLVNSIFLSYVHWRLRPFNNPQKEAKPTVILTYITLHVSLQD